MKLTEIYGIPKLHKNSVKRRSIFATTKCSVKALLKAFTGALKLIYNQIRNNNFKT